MNEREKRPAIQNIPLRTDAGRELRRAFTSTAPIIEADYASLEQRLVQPMTCACCGETRTWPKDFPVTHVATCSQCVGL